ncbi:hypothetical protein SOPP22_01355 [Shewanella sp. OPT22]|nr:hypothetical protein SOPP22_01355 [Shewanella sp. OPT22]
MDNFKTQVNTLFINMKKITVDELVVKYHNHNCYLYSQNAAWVTNNKVNIYYGIWNRKFKTLPGEYFSEYKNDYLVCLNDSTKMKSFGLAKVRTIHVSSIINCEGGEFDNVVLFSKYSFREVYELMSSGFHDVLSEVDFFNTEAKYNALEQLNLGELALVKVLYENDQLLCFESNNLTRHPS